MWDREEKQYNCRRHSQYCQFFNRIERVREHVSYNETGVFLNAYLSWFCPSSSLARLVFIILLLSFSRDQWRVYHSS